MERLDEMREKLKEWMWENAGGSRQETEKYLRQHPGELSGRLMENIRHITRDNPKGKNKIALCCLRSSILDGSDELCLLTFDTVPFVDRTDEAVYVGMPEIFRYAKEKVEGLYREMGRNFIRVLPYEKEEMRREYMYGYLDFVPGFLSLILENDIQGMEVYVGEYMGELVRL